MTNFTELSLEQRDRLIMERVFCKERKRIPRYSSDFNAAWTLIAHIAALPDTPFTLVQKKRLFMRMLGMEPCNDVRFGAWTLATLARLTPETISTAALYVFGRETEKDEPHGKD